MRFASPRANSSGTGFVVQLPPQAFEVLRVLLERNGELVTRQEFHRVLWPADTFVDFDQGLNNAIKRIREVLNDSADSPRYVETLPRLGYRFIGQVDSPQPGFVDQAITNNGAPATVSPESENHQPASPAHTAPPLEVRSGTTVHRRVAAYLLAAAAGVALLATAWLFRPGYPAPHIAGERQLTADGIPKWGPLATDGLRVYFTEKVDGRETVAAVPVSGGQAVPIKMPLAQAGLYGISPDKTDLLVAETPDMFQEAQLWRVPVIGGTPRRLGNAAAHDASWSPDGTKLAYVNRSAIYLANADGSEPRLLVPPVNNPDIWAWRPTWSPDGRRLRFDFFNMDSDASHIWEVNLDGSNAHAVFAPSPDWPLAGFRRLDARRQILRLLFMERTRVDYTQSRGEPLGCARKKQFLPPQFVVARESNHRAHPLLRPYLQPRWQNHLCSQLAETWRAHALRCTHQAPLPLRFRPLG